MVGTVDDRQQVEAAFAVRMLKYGTCEVVLKPDPESPARHIADFRSKDEAQAWIKENARSWHKASPPRR